MAHAGAATYLGTLAAGAPVASNAYKGFKELTQKSPEEQLEDSKHDLKERLKAMMIKNSAVGAVPEERVIVRTPVVDAIYRAYFNHNKENSDSENRGRKGKGHIVYGKYGVGKSCALLALVQADHKGGPVVSLSVFLRNPDWYDDLCELLQVPSNLREKPGGVAVLVGEALTEAQHHVQNPQPKPLNPNRDASPSWGALLAKDSSGDDGSQKKPPAKPTFIRDEVEEDDLSGEKKPLLILDDIPKTEEGSPGHHLLLTLKQGCYAGNFQMMLSTKDESVRDLLFRLNGGQKVAPLPGHYSEGQGRWIRMLDSPLRTTVADVMKKLKCGSSGDEELWVRVQQETLVACLVASRGKTALPFRQVEQMACESHSKLANFGGKYPELSRRAQAAAWWIKQQCWCYKQKAKWNGIWK